MDRGTAEPDVQSLPGDRAKQWVKYHQRRAATSTFVYEFIWDVTAPAIGPFCTDIDGNILLDFASHVAANPLGYNNPKITEPLSEFDAIDPMKIAGQDFYASAGWPPENPSFPGPTQLLDRLIEITDHYEMDTVFLSNSGAEAVENAIKVCYDHVDGKHGITFAGGFHGRTLGALSLNRSKAVHRRGFPEIASIESISFCENRRCDEMSCSCGFFIGSRPDESESGAPSSGESASRIASSLRRMLDPTRGNVDASDVSYLIIEPIQGEGGYRIPSQSFMTEIADVTKEHDIPVIADEIQTGLGRTGEMWGVDHYAIEPDIITSAKALRVGATIGRGELFPDAPGRLSTTWGGGDILSSLRGVLTIDAIQEYDLLSNARERGSQFKERLREEVPDFVVDVRGTGLMLAVEFDSKPRRDAAVCEAFSRGLLTLGCGYRTMRVLPPLDVTAREIDLGVDLLLETFDDQQVKDASPDHPEADNVI